MEYTQKPKFYSTKNKIFENKNKFDNKNKSLGKDKDIFKSKKEIEKEDFQGYKKEDYFKK
ncbi:MAG: hypothetical protein ACTSRG_23945 [Candidatus Helarchaeota archaeon]